MHQHSMQGQLLRWTGVGHVISHPDCIGGCTCWIMHILDHGLPRHLGTMLDGFSHNPGGVIAVGINATVLRG